jgi:hypothetical protein
MMEYRRLSMWFVGRTRFGRAWRQIPGGFLTRNLQDFCPFQVSFAGILLLESFEHDGKRPKYCHGFHDIFQLSIMNISLTMIIQLFDVLPCHGY